MKKRITAILATMLLVPTLLSTARAVGHGYGYWQLSEKQKYVYDAMAEPIGDGETQIVLDEWRRVSVEDTQMAMTIFAADYPEYSWFGVKDGERMYYLDIQKRGDTVVILQPCYNSNDTAADRSALQSAAQTAISGIPATAQSQYDKARYLHDYLAQRVSYAYGTTENMTAYGALVNGSAGCVGYAKAYQYLLQQVGITAWTVMGTAASSNGAQSHAWNVANLDGGWYYIDVTWDDTGSGVSHKYFGLSLSEMSADHTLEAPYSDMCPSGGTVAHPKEEEQAAAEQPTDAAQTDSAEEAVPAEPAPAQTADEPEKEPEEAAEQPEIETAEDDELPEAAEEVEEVKPPETEEQPAEQKTVSPTVWMGISAGAAAAIAGGIVWHRRRRSREKED